MNFKTMRFFILVGFIMIYGCNNFDNKKREQLIENATQMTDSFIVIDYQKSVDTFKLNYQKTLQNKIDSTSIGKLREFYSVLMKKLDYIDSLKTELDKLDNFDTKNTERIGIIFLNNGIADSLFSKIKMSYALAESISSVNTNKNEIRKSRATLLNEPHTEQLKKQLFGLNSPRGMYMLLYGFEKELLKIAEAALSPVECKVSK